MRAEIVIDARVELVAIGVQSIRARQIVAVDAARKANAGCVQTVANRVIVGLRHPREQRVLNEAGRIVSRPEWITVEYAERLKIACRIRGSYWIAVAIDSRIELGHVLVVGSREKAEDALSSLRCQYASDESLAKDVSLFVDEDEKERLVFDDRSTEAGAKLVPVFVVFRYSIEVVEPLAGIERRVTVRPKRAAAELIRSLPRDHLHLSRATSVLGIDRGSDDADFLDQIGTGIRAC